MKLQGMTNGGIALRSVGAKTPTSRRLREIFCKTDRIHLFDVRCWAFDVRRSSHLLRSDWTLAPSAAAHMQLISKVGAGSILGHFGFVGWVEPTPGFVGFRYTQPNLHFAGVIAKPNSGRCRNRAPKVSFSTKLAVFFLASGCVCIYFKGSNFQIRLLARPASEPILLPRSFRNLPPNLTINITAIIPITGIMMVSGGHNPSTDIGAKASSSFIAFVLYTNFSNCWKSPTIASGLRRISPGVLCLP